ncbi:MAG: lipase family protein [Minicystis sp.]
MQQVFALAWTAYVGDDLVDPTMGPDQRAPLLRQRLTRRLSRTAPVQNRWQLAWGPAASQLDGSLLADDTMAYVATTREVPGEIAIAIRGTNPFALPTWLHQDLDVAKPVSWPPGADSSALKIAPGTLLGLTRLEALLPSPAISEDPTSLSVALRALLEQRPGARVTVTGHSLGGVLATVFGLRLVENRDAWDPYGNTPLDVWSFAAPTAGNAAFAQYTDLRLGDALRRFWNTNDIVPSAWDPDRLRLLGDDYTSWGNRHLDFLLGPSMRVFTAALRDNAGGAVYRQPPRGDRPFTPPFVLGLPFLGQILHHHGQAYIDALDLGDYISQFDVVGLRTCADDSLAVFGAAITALLLEWGITWPRRGPLPDWGRGLAALRW